MGKTLETLGNGVGGFLSGAYDVTYELMTGKERTNISRSSAGDAGYAAGVGVMIAVPILVSMAACRYSQ